MPGAASGGVVLGVAGAGEEPVGAAGVAAGAAGRSGAFSFGGGGCSPKPGGSRDWGPLSRCARAGIATASAAPPASSRILVRQRFIGHILLDPLLRNFGVPGAEPDEEGDQQDDQDQKDGGGPRLAAPGRWRDTHGAPFAPRLGPMYSPCAWTRRTQRPIAASSSSA